MCAIEHIGEMAERPYAACPVLNGRASRRRDSTFFTSVISIRDFACSNNAALQKLHAHAESHDVRLSQSAPRIPASVVAKSRKDSEKPSALARIQDFLYYARSVLNP